MTEFFKIMKDNIYNGIIVFSVDTFQLTQNYEIISKLQKILNKPIENFFILLNKIDKSENIENDIAILEGKILNKLDINDFSASFEKIKKKVENIDNDLDRLIQSVKDQFQAVNFALNNLEDNCANKNDIIINMENIVN